MKWDANQIGGLGRLSFPSPFNAHKSWYGNVHETIAVPLQCKLRRRCNLVETHSSGVHCLATTRLKGESAVSVSHRSLLVSHHRTLLMGENYYSFHKQEWKTITRLAAKQVRMHVNRAHIDWVHVMHIQAQARKRLILEIFQTYSKNRYHHNCI